MQLHLSLLRVSGFHRNTGNSSGSLQELNERLLFHYASFLAVVKDLLTLNQSDRASVQSLFA